MHILPDLTKSHLRLHAAELQICHKFFFLFSSIMVVTYAVSTQFLLSVCFVSQRLVFFFFLPLQTLGVIPLPLNIFSFSPHAISRDDIHVVSGACVSVLNHFVTLLILILAFVLCSHKFVRATGSNFKKRASISTVLVWTNFQYYNYLSYLSLSPWKTL